MCTATNQRQQPQPNNHSNNPTTTATTRSHFWLQIWINSNTPRAYQAPCLALGSCACCSYQNLENNVQSTCHMTQHVAQFSNVGYELPLGRCLWSRLEYAKTGDLQKQIMQLILQKLGTSASYSLVTWNTKLNSNSGASAFSVMFIHNKPCWIIPI